MRDGLRERTKSRSWLKRGLLLGAASLAVTGIVRPLLSLSEPLEAAPVLTDGDILHVAEAKTQVRVVEKFARVVALQNRIATVYGFDQAVIDVKQVEKNPRQIRIHAKKPGVTTMVLVDENDNRFTLDVYVAGDVRALQQHLDRLFPDSNVEAVELRDNESVLLRGWVTQPEHVSQMVNVAEQFYGKVLNQMQVGGVQQVQLRVQVMEVQRSKIRRLGINFFYLGERGYLASTPGSLAPVTQLSIPFGGPPGVATSAFGDSQLLLGVTSQSRIFQGFIEALKEEGLLKIQAQPVLVTTNGRPATLVNGGEFPILVPQGLGTISVEFREFGVRMEAVPIILGNGRLRLRLAPEVSERDFANAVTLQGFPIPGLTTRRVNTEVEMRFGETLMIGGLISHRQTAQTFKTPVLGDLPYIGTAFSRKRYDMVETELIIMVTPEFVAPMKAPEIPAVGPGQSTDAPIARELYLYNQIEVPKLGERCDGCNTGVQGEIHSGPVTPGYSTIPPAPESAPPAVQPVQPNQPVQPAFPPTLPAPKESTGQPMSSRGPRPFPAMRTVGGTRQPRAPVNPAGRTFHVRSPGVRQPATNGGLIGPGFSDVPSSIGATQP